MAVDYGKRRVGLAISDPSRRFAFPLGTVDRKRKGLKEEILRIHRETPFTTVVLSRPTREELVAEVRNFARWLENRLKCEVVFWDETYTSVEAERLLREAGKRINAKNKHLVDSTAAYLILSEYLGIPLV